MSVINKMLKQLDQRQATSAPGGPAVRPLRVGVGTGRKGKEAFWRLLAFLLFAGVVWIGVIVFQLQVKSTTVTNLAFRAAEDARARPAPPPAPAPAPAPADANPAAPAQVPALPLVNPETLKMASSIQTQIPPERTPGHRVTPPPPKPTAVQGVPRAAEPSEGGGSPPKSPKPLAGPVEGRTNPGKVEKRDRPRNPQEFAEVEFRRGAGLLNEGRIGDAEQAFSVALNSDRNHESARQALAALLLDQRKIEQARLLLQEGIAINPGNAVFASSLARILIETKEYDDALRVLQGASAAGALSAQFQALVGAAYQRRGNHREAADAYRTALRIHPGTGTSWLGLGISLEALNHPNEAAEAFRRALASGTLTAETRGFAETRLSKAR